MLTRKLKVAGTRLMIVTTYGILDGMHARGYLGTKVCYTVLSHRLALLAVVKSVGYCLVLFLRSGGTII